MSAWRDMNEGTRTIVVLVVMVLVITIVTSLGFYIINALNNGGVTVPSQANLLSPMTSLFGSIGNIIGITILIFFIVIMIKLLMSTPREATNV